MPRFRVRVSVRSVSRFGAECDGRTFLVEVVSLNFTSWNRLNDDLQEFAMHLADSPGERRERSPASFKGIRIASSPSTISTDPSSEMTSAIWAPDGKPRQDRFELCDRRGQIALIDFEIEPVTLREVVWCDLRPYV